MINKIKDFFNKKAEESVESSHSVVNIATAALLIEVMTIDGNMDTNEIASIKKNLSEILDISDSEIQELIELSQEEVEEANDLLSCLFRNIMNGLETTALGLLEDMVKKSVTAPPCLAENMSGLMIGQIADTIQNSLNDILGNLSNNNFLFENFLLSNSNIT